MITGKKTRLRDKKLSDARNDYSWQTDPELARLDAAPLFAASFAQYLLDYTSELCYPTPNRHQFAVETSDGKHIGNCTYYDIDDTKGEAELGIVIGDRDCWDKGYGTDAVITLVNHIFRQTNIKRIRLKTLDWNQRAQKCFQNCGFVPCGHLQRDGHSFMLMELHRKQWED
jgi:RimJ/RimL family protein N-acetyltransferase